MGRLEGKRVLIVGAGVRSGRAMGLLFAAEGARVSLVARKPGPLEETVQAIRAAGGAAWALPGDALDAGRLERLVGQAAEAMGGLDTLVHGVGSTFYAREKLLHELEPEVWADILERGLTSAYAAARLAIPHILAAGGGSILFLAASERVAMLGSPAYAAAKAGLVALGRKMARDYRTDNIRVNVISPGAVRLEPAPTDPVRPVREPLPRTGEERQGEPADIAYAALYLAGDEASWVTGANLIIDGGFNLHNIS